MPTYPSTPSGITSIKITDSSITEKRSASTLDETIEHYHLHADRYQAQYDSIAAEDVHAHWTDLLAEMTPGRVLDVGAGSGRDAKWLADLGWSVTAVEPAGKLREMAQSSNTHAEIRWLDATLPDLSVLASPADQYDLILLSAVWMHLPQNLRAPSFSRLLELLSPQGTLIITLRFGPSDPERPMYPVSVDELIELAAEHGINFTDLSAQPAPDQLMRTAVTWKTVALTYPKELSNE